MADESALQCEELDALLECSDTVLSSVLPLIDCCKVAKRIGSIALLRIACETGQACQFDSLTVDGVTCGGDAKILRLINIVKCMQQICRDERSAEHICQQRRKPSMFNRGCGCNGANIL